MNRALRFSIKLLLAGTVLAAIFCLALKNASPAWILWTFGLAVALLVSAVLLAVFRHGVARAYWIGFAICGWSYLAVLAYGRLELPNPFRPDMPTTTQASIWIHHKAAPWLRSAAPLSPRRPADEADFPSGDLLASTDSLYADPAPNQRDFVNVAHALWTLLLAVLGGWIALLIYTTGPRRESPEAAR